jgi:aryl-alcohol dehydrogenase-like predicted oxidoreductase
VADLKQGDFRTGMPRFQGEAFAANLKLFERFAALAKSADCTPAQLCLAWLLQKDEIIVPIPGTTNPAHMEENAAAAQINLQARTVEQVEALVNAHTVTGPRYAPAMQATVDTEG